MAYVQRLDRIPCQSCWLPASNRYHFTALETKGRTRSALINRSGCGSAVKPQCVRQKVADSLLAYRGKPREEPWRVAVSRVELECKVSSCYSGVRAETENLKKNL